MVILTKKRLKLLKGWLDAKREERDMQSLQKKNLERDSMSRMLLQQE